MLIAQGQRSHTQYSIRRETPAALAKSNSASVCTAVFRTAFNVAPAVSETTEQPPLIECPPGGRKQGRLCKEHSVRGVPKLTAR